MKIPKVVNFFIKGLSREIQNVPDGFYDTFQYTTTGNNLTHPRTIGYITKVVWGIQNAAVVESDLRINEGGVKFQPDIFVRDSKNRPLLVVDYESPNSSDARIPSKNIKPYLKWGESVPYIIVTSLPKKSSTGWELRYTSRGSYNRPHMRKMKEIRSNPFKYWFKIYRHKIKKWNSKLRNVYFVNINAKKVSLETL